jgi:hypothetical protein
MCAENWNAAKHNRMTMSIHQAIATPTSWINTARIQRGVRVSWLGQLRRSL